MDQEIKKPSRPELGGLAGWLLRRLRRQPRSTARLVLHERIALGPRQYLALVEADGRRFLIASGPDGAPSFCALDLTRAKTACLRRLSW